MRHFYIFYQSTIVCHELVFISPEGFPISIFIKKFCFVLKVSKFFFLTRDVRLKINEITTRTSSLWGKYPYLKNPSIIIINSFSIVLTLLSSYTDLKCWENCERQSNLILCAQDQILVKIRFIRTSIDLYRGTVSEMIKLRFFFLFF